MEPPFSKSELKKEVAAEAKRVDEIGEQVADVRNKLQSIQFRVDELKDTGDENGAGARDQPEG